MEKKAKIRFEAVASQVATIFENLRLRGSKMELLIKKCVDAIHGSN